MRITQVMSIIEYSLIVDAEDWEQKLPEYQTVADAAFNATMDFVINEFELELFDFEKEFFCNLILTNDNQVQTLNNQFRNIDKPTNVLSFANVDALDFADNLEQNSEVSLGEIFIAIETLEKEADEKSISLSNHFSHLFVHGILHLLGFDHQTDDDADEMEQIEIDILKTINITNPYEEQNV